VPLPSSSVRLSSGRPYAAIAIVLKPIPHSNTAIRGVDLPYMRYDFSVLVFYLEECVCVISKIN
jgi:hypothetical protein